MKLWTEEDYIFLRENYPSKGKMWCAEMMGRGEASIRQKAARLGLKQDKNSEFFKEWQQRAAKSKIGKKRPDQSLVMKQMWMDGRLHKPSEETRKKLGELHKKWIAENGHPRGMLGKHHTEDTKKHLSLKSKEILAGITEEMFCERAKKTMKTKWEKGTYIIPRKNVSWKGGKREIAGKEIYFRSMWEANYGRYLEWLKQHGQIKEWTHEEDIFWFDAVKRGCVSYLPDFKVIENDGSIVYHEVKGWMDQKSQTKLKRMAKYYPDVKVIVIDKACYLSIKNKLSGMIDGWEDAQQQREPLE